MAWDIVCQIQDTDNFEPSDADPEKTAYVVVDVPDDPRCIGSNLQAVLQQAELVPSAVARDLLNLAIAVYSADVRIPRTSGYDHWTRWFRLHVPVRHLSTWEQARPTLETMLTFLTGDYWQVSFRLATVEVEAGVEQHKKLDSFSQGRTTALLSGGLDSLAGAINLLHQASEPVIFVSHYRRGGVISQVQNNIYSLLKQHYPQTFIPLQFFIEPPENMTGKTDITQRSRSILYIALGVAVASAHREATSLIVPENGFISLNVPLIAGRLGSLSTRTTHPHFMSLVQLLLENLGIPVTVENPYRFTTKGEMLLNAKNKDLLRLGTPLTLSCARSPGNRFDGLSTYWHCGRCVPCLVRRAAIYRAGLDDANYVRDVLQDPPSPAGTKGEDLRALSLAIERLQNPERPAIFDVLDTGPLPGTPSEIESYVSVYRRGVDELRSFLQQPTLN